MPLRFLLCKTFFTRKPAQSHRLASITNRFVFDGILTIHIEEKEIMRMADLRKELQDSLFELGIKEKQMYTAKENKEYRRMQKEDKPLPEDVHQSKETYQFYRIKQTDLTDEEIDRLLRYRRTLYLRSIKNSMIFFVAISVISIICSLFLLR